LVFANCKKAMYEPTMMMAGKATTTTTIAPTESGAGMQIKLAGANTPRGYQGVYVDLKNVMIHYKGEPEGFWADIKTYPAVYELLALVGAPALIAAADKVKPGEIDRIRLEFGNNDFVLVDALKHMMTTEPRRSDALIVNIDIEQALLENENVLITLDFNTLESVSMNENDEYVLKPIIKVRSIVK
jgi:hypothetical protein